MRLVVLTTLGIGLSYLSWRVTTLGEGPMLVLSIPLLLAEIIGFSYFGLFTFSAWHQPHVTPPLARSRTDEEPVDILVAAHGSSSAKIERSLVGCRALSGPTQVFILDTHHRPDIAELARTFSATLIVGTRSAPHALQSVLMTTDAELIVWLTAGSVPMPDLLECAVPYFDDGTVGIVQVGEGLLNPDSLAHMSGGRDEQALVREVLGPGSSRRGFGPWLGSGSILRRQALVSIGGIDTGARSPIQQTLVKLHCRGWKSVFDGRPLIRTKAPDVLDDYMRNHRRRAIDALGLFRSPQSPISVRGLSMSARWSHLARGALYGAGIPQLVYVAVLVFTLLTGILPFSGDSKSVALFWITAVGSQALARRLLSQGTMATGDWLRQAWRTLGADLSAIAAVLNLQQDTDVAVEKGNRGFRALGRMRLLTALVIVVELAVVARAATLLDGSLLPAFSGEDRVLVLVLSLLIVIPMIDVMQFVVRRNQRRSSYRLETTLPIVVGSRQAETLNITPAGVGVVMEYSSPIGRTSSFSLTLPGPDASSTTIEGIVIIRAATSMDNGLVRVGMEFTDLNAEARAALIRYCAIDHGLLAAGSSDREMQASQPGDMRVPRRANQGRALQALTSVALTLGLLTLSIGPRAGSADAAELAQTTVQLVSASGAPISGAEVRYYSNGWVNAGVTDATGQVSTELLSIATEFQIIWNGGSALGFGESSGASVISISMTRLVVEPPAIVVEIDQGSGWQSFSEGLEVLPGKVSFRLADGAVVKFEALAGNDLYIPSGITRESGS